MRYVGTLRDARRAQASRVFAWRETLTQITLHNDSDLPVFYVLVRIRAGEHALAAVLKPGSKEWDVEIPEGGSVELGGALEVTFVDAAGRVWHRSAEGQLTQKRSVRKPQRGTRLFVSGAKTTLRNHDED